MTKVQTKIQIIQILLDNKDELSRKGVSAMALFGSFLNGNPTEESDVDFYVDFKDGGKNFRNFIELAFRLEELLGRKVEIVTKDSLSPYIGPHILNSMEYVIKQ